MSGKRRRGYQSKRKSSYSFRSSRSPAHKRSNVEVENARRHSTKRTSYSSSSRRETKENDRRERDRRHESSKRDLVSSSSSSRNQKEEMRADVMRVARVYENNHFRLILQESDSTPLYLAIIPFELGKDIKFGDRLYFYADIVKKDKNDCPTEVTITEVTENRKNRARDGIHHHSISNKPFCLPPKFIHELYDNPEIRTAVIQVNIHDCKMTFYEGCTTCRHKVKVVDGVQRCPKCKSSSIEVEWRAYTRMRVADWSGQLLLNMMKSATQKLIFFLGVEAIEVETFNINAPENRDLYEFKPVMLEIYKPRDEWEVTDVEDVNWADFKEYMAEKVAQLEDEQPESKVLEEKA